MCSARNSEVKSKEELEEKIRLLLQTLPEAPPSPPKQSGTKASTAIITRQFSNGGKFGPEERTPLHRAAKRGYSNIITLLIEHGAEVNATDIELRTPLHEAATYGKVKACLTLIKHGANVNAEKNTGTTPLLRAILHGHRGCAKVLLRSGAKAILEKRRESNGPSDAAPKLAPRRSSTIVVQSMDARDDHSADANSTLVHLIRYMPELVPQIFDTLIEILNVDQWGIKNVPLATIPHNYDMEELLLHDHERAGLDNELVDDFEGKGEDGLRLGQGESGGDRSIGSGSMDGSFGSRRSSGSDDWYDAQDIAGTGEKERLGYQEQLKKRIDENNRRGAVGGRQWICGTLKRFSYAGIDAAVLTELVRSKRYKLLAHPLIATYARYKWNEVPDQSPYFTFCFRHLLGTVPNGKEGVFLHSANGENHMCWWRRLLRGRLTLMDRVTVQTILHAAYIACTIATFAVASRPCGDDSPFRLDGQLWYGLAVVFWMHHTGCELFDLVTWHSSYFRDRFNVVDVAIIVLVPCCVHAGNGEDTFRICGNTGQNANYMRAVTVLLLFAKLPELLQGFFFFGKPLLMLRFMIQDANSIIWILVLLIIANASTFTQLHATCEDGEESQDKDILQNIVVMFFAMFGISDVVDVKILSCGFVFSSLVFGFHVLMCSLFLLTMMIAIMTNTIGKIDQSARERLRLERVAKIVTMIERDKRRGLSRNHVILDGGALFVVTEGTDTDKVSSLDALTPDEAAERPTLTRSASLGGGEAAYQHHQAHHHRSSSVSSSSSVA